MELIKAEHNFGCMECGKRHIPCIRLETYESSEDYCRECLQKAVDMLDAQ